MKFLSKKVTPEFEPNDPLDLAGATGRKTPSSSGGFAGEEESFQAEPIVQTAEENEAPSGSGADDALGLYLKQMGSIPLLNREKERTLAQKLEARSRSLSPGGDVQLADPERGWARSSTWSARASSTSIRRSTSLPAPASRASTLWPACRTI